MKNAMSLKAKIKNIAKSKNIPAQVILQNYMFERLLARLSKSEYRDKFVLKGGMLVAAMVGLDNRATMDLDTTLKNYPLTPDSIEKALTAVCSTNADDEVEFSFVSTGPIRDDDIYGGYRVSLSAKFDTIIVPLSIDVSAGDAITPRPILFSFYELFAPENTFELWAYNVETVLAEKTETILRRGVFNTRPRDFYDTYILATTQNYDKKTFLDALAATASHRGTESQIADIETIIDNLIRSTDLRQMWEKYRNQFAYASDIEYDAVIEVLKNLLAKVD